MINWQTLKEQLDLPLIATVALLAMSFSAITSLSLSQPSSAAYYQPTDPTDRLSTLRDDYCYHNSSVINQVTGLGGGDPIGLVNAIVNAPIYDWDQGDHIDFRSLAYKAYSLYPNLSFVTAGLRGELKGKSLGYMNDFDFSAQPIPTLPWMYDYLTKQLPVDAGRLAMVAGAQGNPGSGLVNGSEERPFVANPFIYMQGALITPQGLPRFQAITGPMADLSRSLANNKDVTNNQTKLTNILGDVFNVGAFTDMSQYADQQIQANAELINALRSGKIPSGSILDTVGSIANMPSALAAIINARGRGYSQQQIEDTFYPLVRASSSVENQVETLAGLIGNLPGISHWSQYRYEVRGANAADNCYEDLGLDPLGEILSPNSNYHMPNMRQVPAYAFSVYNPFKGPLVFVPGMVYSIMTMLDTMPQFKMSRSGFDLHLYGSMNGKDLLDCFGKGKTPFVTGHANRQVKNYLIPLVNLVYGVDGIGQLILNSAMAVAGASMMSHPPTAAAGEALLNMPALVTKYEQYGSYAFMFSLKKDSLQLPQEYSDRVINYDTSDRDGGRGSKISDINSVYLARPQTDNPTTKDSQNGQQFNPDIYLKLKEPYVLKPVITPEVQHPRQTLDGTTVKVDIANSKHGFREGNKLASRKDDPSVQKYAEDETRAGGPTYDNNAGANGRSFTEARVYKIEIAPGVSANAIDGDKVQGATKQYYSGNTAPGINASTDPCDFFAGQLRAGDTGAAPSALSPDRSSNANVGKDIQNRPLNPDDKNSAFKCGQIYHTDVRMGEGEASKKQHLYTYEEKIPAETPPGTKHCFAVYYTKYTNDLKTQGKEWWDGNQPNYNPNYSTPQDKSYLSRVTCIISGYSPNMQVRGGDLMVGKDVRTGTTTKDYLAGADGEKRTYGSWAEYGILATGAIGNMASGGVYRTGLPVVAHDFGYLTFANRRDSGRAEYGRYTESTTGSHSALNDGFDRVAQQFSSMSAQAQPLPTSPLNTWDSGVYRINSGTTATLTTDGEIPKNKSIIILAERNARVNIANDIRTRTTYESVGDISQVVIAPASGAGYHLEIGSGVAQVDAWLINPSGVVNTCYTGLPAGHVQNTPHAKSLCDTTLTVNGPVSAAELKLRRSGGKDQSDDPRVIAQSVPAENFNLRPDAYIWAANYVSGSGRKYITTNVIDLPPRY